MMKDGLKEKEGYIRTKDRSIYYHIFGEGGRTPLLTLHGGPGVSHRTILNLKGLANERPVVFYDQFCSGKSTVVPSIKKDPSLWVIENFVSEVDVVRNELGLDDVHLFGNSFGTMVMADYLLTKPKGLKSLIFSSSVLSARRWKKDSDRLRRELPKEVQEILIKHEEAGTTDSKEYESAVLKYYKRFLCRLDPWPKELSKIVEGLNKEMYLAMWGPSEFYPTGNLKDYDRTDVLKNITVPTLFTCGRYDEATPEATAYYKSLTPNAEMAIYEKSAHMALFEEKELVLRTISDFLIKSEG